MRKRIVVFIVFVQIDKIAQKLLDFLYILAVVGTIKLCRAFIDFFKFRCTDKVFVKPIVKRICKNRRSAVSDVFADFLNVKRIFLYGIIVKKNNVVFR